MGLLGAVHDYFAPAPHHFEHFAAEIWLRSDTNVESVDVTRPSRDGGIDAVGNYLVGPRTDPIRISFALEAKCLQPGGAGVSVRMVSRLISRLKHRDFGVLVTTAHIGSQPYQEVRDDMHPVVFLTGADIIEALATKMGIRTMDTLQKYLHEQHPLLSSSQISIDGHHAEADVELPTNEQNIQPNLERRELNL